LYRGVGNRKLQRPQELRAQAEWYRGWSDFGTAEDRAWREGLAEYLEKLANEIEYRRARAEQRKHAA